MKDRDQVQSSPISCWFGSSRKTEWYAWKCVSKRLSSARKQGYLKLSSWPRYLRAFWIYACPLTKVLSSPGHSTVLMKWDARSA